MVWYKAPTASVSITSVSLEIEDLPNFEGFGAVFDREFSKEIKKIGFAGKEFWKSEAGRRLHTSRESYQKSITLSSSSGSVNLTLGGKGGTASKHDRWLALAIESGTPSYDLKPGFLKGMTHRVIPLDTKDQGRIYRTVKSVGHENKWIRKATKGIHLADIVTQELNNNIIPKHVQAAFDRALKDFK